MNILGINTCCKITTIALKSGQSCFGTNIELGRNQSRELPVLVEKLLNKANIKFSDLDYIAAATGPGYYTGIRAGLAYAAALAEALSIKIIPLSSLEILACDLLKEKKNGLFMPLLKAKRSSVYGAVYGYDKIIEAPAYFKTEDALALASEHALSRNADISIVTPDRESYQSLKDTEIPVIERECAPEQNCLLLAEKYISSATAPYAVRGTYLRAPDIGPCRE